MAKTVSHYRIIADKSHLDCIIAVTMRLEILVIQASVNLVGGLVLVLVLVRANSFSRSSSLVDQKT